MGRVKAKSAKEINAEIKQKRNPAAGEAGDIEPKETNAAAGVEDTNDAGADQSVPEAQGEASSNNDGSSEESQEPKAE